MSSPEQVVTELCDRVAALSVAVEKHTGQPLKGIVVDEQTICHLRTLSNHPGITVHFCTPNGEATIWIVGVQVIRG